MSADDVTFHRVSAPLVSPDDVRYFRFERTTSLPIGTWPRKERRRWPTADRCVCWTCLIVFIVAAVFVP